MKILITGGAGFIGSNLYRILQKQNDVDIFDKKYCYDYGKRKYDTIIHLAAITDTTFKPDAELINYNVKLFNDILKFALKINADLIYASSAAVYGNRTVPMKENQRLQPLNAYARSKFINDNRAKSYMDRIKIIGLRYFNVYGNGEEHKGKSASTIYQIRNQILSNLLVKLFEYGGQKRDHVYIKDVIAATIKAIKAKHSGIYNVGTGVATTFNDLFEYVNEVLETSAGLIYCKNPYAETYQNHTQADIKLIKKELKWEPKWNLKKGIKDYFKILSPGHF